MKVSVEISMYPLSEEYEDMIIDFINRLNTYSDITVQTNGMSTQVFGIFEDVFSAINKEMKVDFCKNEKMIFVMKCVNADLNIQ